MYDDFFLKLVGTCLHRYVRIDPSSTRKMAKKYLAFSDDKGFMRFRNLVYKTDNVRSKIHIVPLYSLPHLKQFVDEMVDRMKGYKTREETKTLKMFDLSRDAAQSRNDIKLLQSQMVQIINLHKKLPTYIQDSSSTLWTNLETLVSETQVYYKNVTINTLVFLNDSQKKVEKMMFANRKVDVLTINAEVGSAKLIVKDMKKVVKENTRRQIKYHADLKESLKDLVDVLVKNIIQIAIETELNQLYHRVRYVAEMTGMVVDAAIGNPPSASDAVSKTFDVFEKMGEFIIRANRVMMEILGIFETLDNYDDFEPVFTSNLSEALQAVSMMDELDDALNDYEDKSERIYAHLDQMNKIFDPAELKKQLMTVVNNGRDFVEEVSIPFRNLEISKNLSLCAI